MEPAQRRAKNKDGCWPGLPKTATSGTTRRATWIVSIPRFLTSRRGGEWEASNKDGVRAWRVVLANVKTVIPRSSASSFYWIERQRWLHSSVLGVLPRPIGVCHSVDGPTLLPSYTAGASINGFEKGKTTKGFLRISFRMLSLCCALSLLNFQSEEL